MVITILASHGYLADGVKSAVDMILGENDNVKSFCLKNYPSPQEISAEVSACISNNADNKYIILTDIKGGSIHNALLPLCKNENVFLVSGMNLNMALECSMIDENSDMSFGIKEAIEVATKNICYYDSQILKKEIETEEEDDLW